MKNLLNGVANKFNNNGEFATEKWKQWMQRNFGAGVVTNSLLKDISNAKNMNDVSNTIGRIGATSVDSLIIAAKSAA